MWGTWRQTKRAAAALSLLLLLGSPAAKAAQPDRLLYQPGYPTVATYQAARLSLDPALNDLTRAYVGGLSDGLYAGEMLGREAGLPAVLCFGPEGAEPRPAQEEAIRILDAYVAALFQIGRPAQLIESLPLMTVLHAAYKQAYSCFGPQAEATPQPTPTASPEDAAPVAAPSPLPTPSP